MYYDKSVYTGGYLRQEFIFTKVPFYKGKHKVVPSQNGYSNETDPAYRVLHTATSDGDVGGDVYNIFSGENNYIQIDEINPDTQEIKGRFQVTMVLEHINYSHFLPATLRFTAGKFHTKFTK